MVICRLNIKQKKKIMNNLICKEATAEMNKE